MLSRKKMGATNGGVEYTLLEGTAKQRWMLAGSKGLSAAAAVNDNRDRTDNANTSTIGTTGSSSNDNGSNSNSESKAPGGFAGRSLLAAAQDPTAIAPQSTPSTKDNATQSSSPSAAGSIRTTSTETLTAGPASPSPTAEPTVENSSETSSPSLPPPEEAARSSSGAASTSPTTPGSSSLFNQTPEAKVAVVPGAQQEDTAMSVALAASERLVAELQASSALRTEQVLLTYY